uniref:Uncharacterized protein n=1 Tax=Glossina austeni TaxID=7395 RepID=A0A1A9URF7_GLOAU
MHKIKGKKKKGVKINDLNEDTVSLDVKIAPRVVVIAHRRKDVNDLKANFTDAVIDNTMKSSYIKKEFTRDHAYFTKRTEKTKTCGSVIVSPYCVVVTQTVASPGSTL